jgi:hypothetical protein
MARNTWQNLLNEDPRGTQRRWPDARVVHDQRTRLPDARAARELPEDGRLISVKAKGIWAATATPTYTFRLQNTVGTTVTIVTGAAITVSAITNQAWELELLVQCRTEGTSGTVLAQGHLNMGGVTGTSYLPATGTAPATATVDTTIAQTWGVEIACSASSASNTVKGIILEVTAKN